MALRRNLPGPHEQFVLLAICANASSFTGNDRELLAAEFTQHGIEVLPREIDTSHHDSSDASCVFYVFEEINIEKYRTCTRSRPDRAPFVKVAEEPCYRAAAADPHRRDPRNRI